MSELTPSLSRLTTSKKLLILGGNRYHVPGIQAARAAGFFTLVADRNPQAPGLRVADIGLAIDPFDIEQLSEATRAYGGIDGVLSIPDACMRPAAQLADRFGLPSLGQEVISRATSKAAMRRSWTQLREYSTDFYVVKTEAAALRAVRLLDDFPLIFKPDLSFGGSRGVFRIDSESQVPEAFLFAQSGGLPQSEIIIERFVTGTEYSAEVLIWEGQTSILCIGKKVKSKYPYRVDVSVQYPAQFSANQSSAVTDMCHRAITSLGITQGVAHVEFVCAEQSPVLFELGARCGGGHTPQIAYHVSGINEFIEACRMACGMAPTQFFPSLKRGADYRFLVFPPGEVTEIRLPDQVKSHPNVLDVAITLQPGETVLPLRTTSDRAGFVVTVADDGKTATDLANWASCQISLSYRDASIAYANPLTSFEELKI